MSKIEQFSRIINHRITTAGGLFTIPTSNDHTDETWLGTDLYIGEIGLNITDDKAYMRTNNGIVQLATGTSSGGTSSAAQVFVFNSPNIQISSTYSADAIIPKSGYFTDLGSTALRFKNLNLGGAAGGQTTIDTNLGLALKTTANGILTTDGVASSNAPIEVHTTSSNVNKNRPLYLNTRSATSTGSTNYITSASVNGLSTSNNSHVFAAAGSQISFDDGKVFVSHIGQGFGRPVYEDNLHVVGGKSAVKGVADDGTGQYDKSEWTTSQGLLRTSDANMTDIVNIPWTATASGGNVIQAKAYIVCTVIDDANLIYSAEVIGTFAIDSSFVPQQIGTPISNVVSSWIPPNTAGTAQPDCEMSCDASGFYIKVQGVGTSTIQWLCSYSYHKLIGIV